MPLVVQSFNQTEADVVVRVTVGNVAVSMTLYHARKLAVGFQALPLGGFQPAIKEYPCTSFGVVVTILLEGTIEQLVRVEPLIDG